jgi:hypothetical protein
MRIKKFGLCPKCLEMKNLTFHHIFPLRFFKNKRNGAILMLCRDCHTELEFLIPQKPRLSKEEYIKICINFLKEGKND